MRTYCKLTCLLAEGKLEWEKSNVDTQNLVQILGNSVLGLQFPQRDCCKELLYKWKMAHLPDCDCIHPSQTLSHSKRLPHQLI